MNNENINVIISIFALAISISALYKSSKTSKENKYLKLYKNSAFFNITTKVIKSNTFYTLNILDGDKHNVKIYSDFKIYVSSAENSIDNIFIYNFKDSSLLVSVTPQIKEDLALGFTLGPDYMIAINLDSKFNYAFCFILLIKSNTNVTRICLCIQDAVNNNFHSPIRVLTKDTISQRLNHAVAGIHKNEFEIYNYFLDVFDNISSENKDMDYI